MKLIGSVTSPYVCKVRIVMAEKKLDYTFVQEDISQPNSTISQFNPLGKIPCLVMEDGDTLFDSRVIVEYLDTLSPVGRLIPATGRERAQVRTWEALADGVVDALILARLEATWPQRTPEQRCQAWVDRQMKKVVAGLMAMNTRLETALFCAGNAHWTLADIALGCCLDFLVLRFPDHEWRTSHPHLVRWHSKWLERPSVQQTAPNLTHSK
jgi:glutathione S-transferase